MNEYRNIIQGQIAISTNANATLTTILGSCISVCMFDKEHGIGGMNHYLLPYKATPDTEIARLNLHGPSAIEALHNKLLAKGASPHGLQAKIFGGGAVIAGMFDIGSANAQTALETLERLQVPILVSDTGGDQARRLRFFPSQGVVKVQKLSCRNAADELT